MLLIYSKLYVKLNTKTQSNSLQSYTKKSNFGNKTLNANDIFKKIKIKCSFIYEDFLVILRYK